jgi:hypothetical protein
MIKAIEASTHLRQRLKMWTSAGAYEPMSWYLPAYALEPAVSDMQWSTTTVMITLGHPGDESWLLSATHESYVTW